MAAYAAAFAVLAVAVANPGFVAGAALFGLGHGLLFPILSSQVVTRARATERGSAMAIFTSLFDFAVLIAAPIVGAAIDWRGYTAAFGGLSVFIAVGLVGYVFWDRAVVREADLAATQVS